jgi:uncharacterized membrane protein YeaQ/YmgE (transglycosylase-associated protein family)
MAGKSAGSVLLFIVLGGLCGALASHLLGGTVDPNGFLHKILVQGFVIGLTDPLTLDLKIIVLKFGLNFDVTVPSLTGMITGLYLAMR